MDDDLDSGLFNIALSDDETGDNDTAAASGQNGNDGAAAKGGRNAQSQEAFLAVKKESRPKLDNGEVSHPTPGPLVFSTDDSNR